MWRELPTGELTKRYSGDNMEDEYVGGKCGTWGVEEKFIQGF